MSIRLLPPVSNGQYTHQQQIHQPTPQKSFDAIPFLQTQPSIWAPAPFEKPKFDFYQDWIPVIGVSERGYPVQVLLTCKDVLMTGGNKDHLWCFYYELGCIARGQGDDEMAIQMFLKAGKL